MPWPNSPSSTGEPRGTNNDGFEEFNRRFDKPHYSEFQVKDSLSSLKAEAERADEERKVKPDIAEENASKQLGQIHAYINEHFPQETGKGKTVAEMVITIFDFLVMLK